MGMGTPVEPTHGHTADQRFLQPAAAPHRAGLRRRRSVCRARACACRVRGRGGGRGARGGGRGQGPDTGAQWWSIRSVSSAVPTDDSESRLGWTLQLYRISPGTSTTPGPAYLFPNNLVGEAAQARTPHPHLAPRPAAMTRIPARRGGGEGFDADRAERGSTRIGRRGRRRRESELRSEGVGSTSPGDGRDAAGPPWEGDRLTREVPVSLLPSRCQPCSEAC
jgi:hypothetical protein